MKIHHSIENLPAFRNAVITIGTFDGVHEGHKKIIKALTDEANAVNGESVIITFDPHPRKVIRNDTSLQLINTLQEKIELLDRTAIDHLVIVPFSLQFAEQTADEYIDGFLISNFHPHTIITGYDHRFGKDRKGSYQLLESKSSQYNYKLVEIPKHVLDEIDVSSTKIRNAILHSDIQTANRLLGYDFFFEGKVVRGDQLGRKLGFPTANLEYTSSEKIHLGHGVYAVYVDIDAIKYKGMLSIGTRPTLSDPTEKVEVNIFNFDKEIYGRDLKVTVKKYLRAQEKYASLEDLIKQLHLDKENSFKVLP